MENAATNLTCSDTSLLLSRVDVVIAKWEVEDQQSFDLTMNKTYIQYKSSNNRINRKKITKLDDRDLLSNESKIVTHLMYRIETPNFYKPNTAPEDNIYSNWTLATNMHHL